MADVKQSSFAVIPIDTPDNDSGRTENVPGQITIKTETKSPLWRRVLSFVWDSADGDPEYRAYVQRLDMFLL